MFFSFRLFLVSGPEQRARVTVSITVLLSLPSTKSSQKSKSCSSISEIGLFQFQFALDGFYFIGDRLTVTEMK